VVSSVQIGRQGDYFAFMGLPRKLVLSPQELDERFRTLSRQFHPDYFYNATAQERLASLERSSYLNSAYRTLRQPISRMSYLLEIEGVWTASDRAQVPGSNQVPESLLEEVFALNEELDEIRELRAAGAPAAVWQARLNRARQPIDARRDAHEQQLEQLFDRWDALVEHRDNHAARVEVLNALRQRLLERNYISNLLVGIEKELAA
jgi:molecular chaperone HscB